jgi:hypothetical protein
MMHAWLQLKFKQICRNCQLLLDLSIGEYRAYSSPNARILNPKPEARQQRRRSMALAVPQK